MDVTDETVGATTTNVPVGGVREVQVSQSLLAPSAGLASAGLVNVLTNPLPRMFTARSLVLVAKICRHHKFSRRPRQFLLA